MNEENRKKKLQLLACLNWDTSMTEEEILDMIERDDPNDRIEIDNFYIKSLERLGWYDILELWGLERCKSMFTERTKRMIFLKEKRETYDAIFKLLRGESLPFTGRSDEDIEKLRSALLFNRRHRYKQGVFSSPLLRYQID